MKAPPLTPGDRGTLFFVRMLADPEKVGQEIQSEGSHPLGVGCSCTCRHHGDLASGALSSPSALSFHGGDPRVTAEMGRSWSVCVPMKTPCVQEVPLGGFWAVGGAALDLGSD